MKFDEEQKEVLSNKMSELTVLIGLMNVSLQSSEEKSELTTQVATELMVLLVTLFGKRALNLSVNLTKALSDYDLIHHSPPENIVQERNPIAG